jgi:PD-(D/E)XK nuclease superfamily
VTRAEAGAPASRLLLSLEKITAQHPTVRKRFLGVDVNHGRELLLALGCRRGGWIGWEATTLRAVADDLAFVALNERGLRMASDVELGAMVTAAFDRVAADGELDASFTGLGTRRGFRNAVQDALLELRMAGVSPASLRAAAPARSPAFQLASLLEAYERVIAEHSVADPAEVFRIALESFDAEAAFVLDGVTALVPLLPWRGLTGALLARVRDHGAVLLDIDRAMPPSDAPGAWAFISPLLAELGDDCARSVLGWSLASRVPDAAHPRFDPGLTTVDLFSAATPTDELREICRRVLAEQLRWDDVEIVTTDPDSYGIALDALCQQLDIGATMLKGLPLARTRIGRALERWFGWLRDGLPADRLRQALEAGDLHLPGTTLTAAELAVSMRAHRIGWGRARYIDLVARLSTVTPVVSPTGDDAPDDDAAVAARIGMDRALGALLAELLRITPVVPERGSHAEVPITCATLAVATRNYLALVPLYAAAERQAMDRVRQRLDRLASLDEPATDFASALAELEEGLADLRAWPDTRAARQPYRADGGLLHLTDLAHAGTSGRRRTFVVGLDADRAGGGVRQDPLLPDSVRRHFGRDRLPETADRRVEWAERLGVALSSLRGRVTLSWAIRAGGDGRDVAPAPLLLQVFRVMHHDDTRTYQQLREAVSPPVCAVPEVSGGVAILDTRDAWLAAIGAHRTLADAHHRVREAFPLLAAGLLAQERAQESAPTAYHGMVPAAGVALDPMRAGSRVLSPSGLEALGKCPLHWFYRYGLGLRPPEDPEFDADAWLDPLQRGNLLHAVFETFVRQYLGRQDDILADAAAHALSTLTQELIDRQRATEPPPSESVYEAEAAELHRAARAFLQLERDALRRGERARWTEVEYGFGDHGSASYQLSTGERIPLRGRADRIDTLPDDTLRLVDYKTGHPRPYRPDPKRGAFNGGRLLQPALYADAVGAARAQRVARFEYRFPTDRGGNAIVGFDAGEMHAARAVITGLVAHVQTGTFVPTTDADDCRFCDHAPICRVSADDFSAHSPRAAWAAAIAAELAEYESMRRRRGTPASDGTA